MSTRMTFEDRLLGELKREIELREAAAGGAGSAEVAADEGKARARRLVTRRRIAVAAAACALAGLAAVGLPGSPAYTTAYAVERHGDGSVTLTIKDQAIGIEAQRQLARQLRPNGIHVVVQVLPSGYICESERGKAVQIWGFKENGARAPIRIVKRTSQVVLRRGNLLVFENYSGNTEPYAVSAYTAKGEYKPCVPVKPSPPSN